jgi:drug/metabolite transporter (DMT)-like permease
MDQKQDEKKFLYGMIASMLCWGISWPVGKIISSYGAAENIALIRFALTFFSLLLILLILKEPIKISTKGIPALLAACICMTLYSYLFLEGLHHGKAGAGGVLATTLNPIISYGLAMILVFKAPKKKELIGLLLGLLAGGILLKIWSDSALIFDAGNLYFILATFVWAVLSKFTSLSNRYGSPVSFSLWLYALCTLAMLLFSDSAATLKILGKSDLKFWLSLIFSATITTSLATTFYFYATAKIGANKASGFLFMVPLSAALGSWIILGEIPLWNTLLGGIIGIIAVYVLNYTKKEV